MKHDYTVTIADAPESVVEIKGTLAWESFLTYEQKAFDRLAAHLELDGFRKGHVPEAVARKHIVDELLLPDMAELALQTLYPIILEEKKIDAIGKPELAITKIARGNALGFTIRTAILPNITLPDYKAVAKSVPVAIAAPVEENEIAKVLEDLRQMRAYGHVHGEGEGVHEHPDQPLPEVNDEFAVSFGFKTVAELRTKVLENLTREREVDTKDKRRVQIMEAIIAKTVFEVPDIILKSEQEKMLAQIEADIARSGMSMEDYLKHTNKTREALLEEYKPEAEKRARFQLVLNTIARDAKLAPTDEEVTAEAERLVATYPGADMARAAAYADMSLTNDKTLSMLESQ